MSTAIALSLISPAEDNPRRTMDTKKTGELAASMARVGLLQPIVVRPRGERHYEIVFGHRRFAAAQVLGWDHIDCIEKPCGDEELLELRLMENLQRADVDPLDEAEALEVLHKRGHAVEVLAERLGKSPAYVYQHMRLARLSPAAKKSLTEEGLPLTHALLLAGIPDQDTQRVALKEWQNGYGNVKGWLALSDVRQWLMRHAQRDVSKAVFPTDDATLLPAAGPCSTCSKRAGMVPGLFDEAENTCMDDSCWRKKVRAFGERRLDELAASGAVVVPVKAVFHKPYFAGGGHNFNLGSKYARPSEEAEYALGNKKWSALLKGDARPPSAYVQNPDTGEVEELWLRSDIEKGLKAVGIQRKKDGRVRSPQSTPQQLAANRKAKLAAQVDKRAEDEIVQAVVDKLDGASAKAWDELWRVIARAALRRAWSDVTKAMAVRRGLKPGGAESQLVALAKTGATARALAVETLITHSGGYGSADPMMGAAKALGVNVAAIRARIRKELEAGKKPRAKAPAKAPAKAKRKAPAKRARKA